MTLLSLADCTRRTEHQGDCVSYRAFMAFCRLFAHVKDARHPKRALMQSGPAAVDFSVHLFVAISAQGDQVLFLVATRLAAEF
jgi:hypothetical protein